MGEEKVMIGIEDKSVEELRELNWRGLLPVNTIKAEDYIHD
jgi:hypothetical protein